MIAAEVEGGGPFIFFGSLVAYLWIGNFLEPVWSFTTTNVVGIVVGICSYLILGAIWSFFKWYKYVSKEVARYAQNKSYYFKEDGALKPEYTTDLKIYWHYDKLSTWIFCWPTSVVLYILGDFLFNLISNVTQIITNTFKKVYDKITESAINKVSKK